MSVISALTGAWIKDDKLLGMQTCWNQQTWTVCCIWFLYVKSTHRNKFAYLVFIILGIHRGA